MGEFFLPERDLLSVRSLSPEGQSIAEGSEAQGRPMAPGVLGMRRWPETYSASLRRTALDKNSQSHPIFTAAVLRVVPRTPMRGYDPDHQTAHGEKQDVARENIKKAFDQLNRSKVAPALEAAGVAPWSCPGVHAEDDGCESDAGWWEGDAVRRCPWNVEYDKAGRSQCIFSCSCFCFLHGPLIQTWYDRSYVWSSAAGSKALRG